MRLQVCQQAAPAGTPPFSVTLTSDDNVSGPRAIRCSANWRLFWRRGFQPILHSLHRFLTALRCRDQTGVDAEGPADAPTVECFCPHRDARCRGMRPTRIGSARSSGPWRQRGSARSSGSARRTRSTRSSRAGRQRGSTRPSGTRRGRGSTRPSGSARCTGSARSSGSARRTRSTRSSRASGPKGGARARAGPACRDRYRHCSLRGR
jgi:hypothetical protein